MTYCSIGDVDTMTYWNIETFIQGILEQLDVCCCCCVYVKRPTNSYGHMEAGPRLKVSSDRLVKPRIEPVIPGLQGRRFIHYTTAAPIGCLYNDWTMEQLDVYTMTNCNIRTLTQ